MINDQNYELFIATNECMALSIIKQTQCGGIFIESASLNSSILESSTSDTYEVLYERLIHYTLI